MLLLLSGLLVLVEEVLVLELVVLELAVLEAELLLLLELLFALP
ncbi:MAG TPA: hypothetical protein VJR89_20230 [Polyangiales bacterium]|nr:hypothetical protein [Polyangiales bacterium]